MKPFEWDPNAKLIIRMVYLCDVAECSGGKTYTINGTPTCEILVNRKTSINLPFLSLSVSFTVPLDRSTHRPCARRILTEYDWWSPLRVFLAFQFISFKRKIKTHKLFFHSVELIYIRSPPNLVQSIFWSDSVRKVSHTMELKLE